MSNIRWDSDAWETVTPRRWRISTHNPARFSPDIVEVRLPRKDTWLLYVNQKYITAFNTWDEAAGAAPMLYQLHKDN
jgi:hypothetical protein